MGWAWCETHPFVLYTKGTAFRGVEGVCNPVPSLGLHPEVIVVVQEDFQRVNTRRFAWYAMGVGIVTTEATCGLV
jgi:hypothetical protein